MEQVAVTEPLERALLLLSHSLEEKGIRVAKTYATEEKIKVVSNEIMQVILNILKNSEYNFKEKGVENPRIDVRTEKEGNRVKIVLCDNGGGIPEHIMGHIFDPYYTTKDEINGTGLGLYMSKMMIEEHHGGALLVSNTEEGVCFTLLFPAAASSQV
jgi:signal transduction histidine kinase